jgi:hypothetical protein
VIHVFLRDELMFGKYCGRHRTVIEISASFTISSPYFSGKYPTEPIMRVFSSRISARPSGEAF